MIVTPDKFERSATTTNNLRKRIIELGGVNKTYLELGSDLCYTAINVSHAFERVVCYEINAHRYMQSKMYIENLNIKNIEVRQNSTNELSVGNYDVVLIDADHSYDCVKHDFDTVFQRNVATKFCVIFHDYGLINNDTPKGVRHFVRERFNKFELIGEKDGWNVKGISKTDDYEAALVIIEK